MVSPNELLLEIAHCPVVRDLRNHKIDLHDCQEIVAIQTDATFQIPEPWLGQIEHAPVLFVSSNPSIDEHEVFPTVNEQEWADQRIVDFFQNRFTPSSGWVKDGKVLRDDGYSGRKVRFWSSARNRASEILQKERGAVVPGVDFALTEVVHCKSRGELGVDSALRFCPNRYLGKVLEMAAARVLIVYGRVARDAVCRMHEVGRPVVNRLFGPVVLHGASRILVFLPHPSARRGKKTFEPEELDAIHSHLESKSQA